ncbi:uncharacterized protein K460DRAFT_377656 [Cucurbitaria berberidis CBS 394.84]|uniref:Uncharacterized protein n=1 Tax=Cucurbitaria berberidis CBS 394.84 TaxID=1168544 RepID=A0A9P4GJW1_9PLEO|nr:uncharacterized protein K460DRAFT_377656 [Cucurbitaria berberidis CBS 394.84]KAF1846460.1 hypothetical protein K460DRAFT_377656 [Cucurbitaria berberidis CBS 394.84]
MSFQTQPAYVHYGTWDYKTRQHECMNWMERYTNAVDSKAWDTEPFSNWSTSDHTLLQSTGETVPGGDSSWSSLRTEVYAPFAQHHHDPQFFMLGVATLHWNLVAPGEEAKVKGRDGKEWDGSGPAAFNFRYVKQSDGGIWISRSAIFADPTVAVVAMLKRGMMKPEDFLK